MVLIKDFNKKNVVPYPHPLPKVYMSCFDFAPFLYQPKMPTLLAQQQVDESKSELGERRSTASAASSQSNDKIRCKYQPQIELLMGTDTGVVFCFDPELIEKGIVVKYNNKD